MSIVQRFSSNPLISPADVKPSSPEFEVLCSFNPGATMFNGKPLLLVRIAERPIPEKGYVSTGILDEESGEVKVFRVRLDDPDLKASDPRLFEYRGETFVTSISHIRKATSEDGIRFTISDTPTLAPQGPYETYGIEDPRITKLGEDYYVSYSAISAKGVATSLSRTKDFVNFERFGVMFAPDNKDIALFPEKIGGRYFAFHRPSLKHLGMPSLWLASSENLLDWGRHQFLIGPRPGMWDCERVGCGAAPIKTSEGWLELYHASDKNTRYCTGAILLDLHEPWKVIARSEAPFLFPEAPYELHGFMPNIIFHSGLIDKGDGTLDLFYGGADEFTCAANVSIKEILATLK